MLLLFFSLIKYFLLVCEIKHSDCITFLRTQTFMTSLVVCSFMRGVPRQSDQSKNPREVESDSTDPKN